MWGAARGYSDELLRSAGVQAATVHDYRDVLFGGHAPEPDDHLLEDLRAKMRETGAQIGIGAHSRVPRAMPAAGFEGLIPSLGKPAAAVRGCRSIGKRDMKLNDALPRIQVDAETYIVTADGEELRAKPADVLPLAQRYFLF